jgi:hypothetical protein
VAYGWRPRPKLAHAARVTRGAHDFGRVAPERGRRSDELIAICGLHALLTNNIALAWNTYRMEQTPQTQGRVDRIAAYAANKEAFLSRLARRVCVLLGVISFSAQFVAVGEGMP